MTPKEKAKQLVHKYKPYASSKFIVDNYVNEPMQLINAKQCALIAVDEIIKYHKSLYNKGFKDVHISLSSPIKTYNDILNPLLKYLEEVKQEIEKS